MPKKLMKLPPEELEARLNERTLVMCKPEAVLLSRHGEILSRIVNIWPLKTPLIKTFSFTKEAIEEFYGHVIEDYEPKEDILASFHKMVGLPTLAIVVQGPNSIATMRKLAGGLPKYAIDGSDVRFRGYSAQFDPTLAPIGTVRGDMCSVSTDFANSIGMPVPNFMHASDSPDSYKKEIGLLKHHKLISDGDFVDYKRPDQDIYK